MSGLTCSAIGLPASCSAMFTGTIANGGACHGGIECAVPNSLCQSCAPGTPGQCVAPSGRNGECVDTSCEPDLLCYSDKCQDPARAGESCAANYCAAGLFCDSSKTCVAEPTSGPCADFACAVGYVCPRGGANSGVCVPPLEPGDACTPGANECAFGVTCDPSSSQCVEDPKLGGACGLIGSAYVGCLEGYCQTDASFVGTCVAQVGLDGPCDAAQPGQCATGTTCGASNTCVADTCF